MPLRPEIARRGLLSAAVGLALSLVAITGASWWQIRDARRELDAAQAAQLGGHLLRCAHGRPLADCIAEEDGVRWALLDDSPRYGRQTWGVDAWPDVHPDRPGAYPLDDGYVRGVAMLPPPGSGPRPGDGPGSPSADGPEAPAPDGRGPPPGRGEPPTDGADPSEGSAPPDPPDGAPMLQVDFLPLFADGVEVRARNSFVLASLVGFGLCGTAFWLGRTQQRAEAAEADLARNRELAALGTMSAVLAHEIRNPIAALLGNAQLLAEDIDSEQVRHVVQAARRLRTLTENLLAFARTGTVQRALVDPREPARTALGDRGVLLDNDSPPRWSLDPERVEQLLRDLVDNAPTPVELSIHVEADMLVYTVRDRGPGLPEGDPERLFEPFYTARAQGTGLGLAIVRRLVEAHGGIVRAGNHPDGGAVFTVRIPGST